MTEKSMNLGIALILVTVLAAPAVAISRESRPAQQGSTPEKYDAIPGKAFMTAAALAEDTNPCAADIARFCSNLRPGKGAIADCLKQNEAQLSPECRELHLAEISAAIRNTHQACETDSVRFCGSYLQSPDERLLNCLKLNAPSLSSECRARLFEALDLMHY